ncbi:hypothetical protein GF345_03870 [Candidatus Woesearchaeota archaeon]|nr:hypothetical protein [Candidatus Woesearchaeota archaeon]
MKERSKRGVLITIGTMMMISLMVSCEAFIAQAISINEILYNPEGKDNNQEFIELLLEQPENLTGYIISDSSSDDTLSLMHYSESDYALIVEEGFDLTGINSSVYSAGATIGNNLDNTADEIFFYTPESTLVASASYDGSIAGNNGHSMELVDGEWLESIGIGGTPGTENTAGSQDASSNETYQENETNTTDPTGCSIDFLVTTDNDLYNNSEKVKIRFDIEPAQDDFMIRYWVEDLAGNIAKSEYNTTNTNQKSWTPNIDEEDKSFFVKAVLYSRCTISSESMFTVKGEAKPAESYIKIKYVYLGEDDSIEFGKPLRVRLDIYKGDESSSTVQVWIEDLDSSEKTSDTSKLILYERFQQYDMTIPVQIKNNCDDDLSDGSYTLVAEGFDLRDTQEVRIEGITSSLCPVSSLTGTRDPGKKISYEIIDYEEEIIPGQEFSTELRITSDDDSHDFSIWSYAYRGSKCYSGEREGNKVAVHLGPGQTEDVELENVVEEADPGDYRLKIKILKDDLKTPVEFTKDISIAEPEKEEKNKSISLEVKAIVGSNSNNSEKDAKKEDKPGMGLTTGKTVYRSKSEKAGSMAIYFIIAALAVMIIIVAVRYFRH